MNNLVDNFPIVSDQMGKEELRVIVRELQKVLGVRGDVVEFGCYVGTTSLFLQRTLTDVDKKLHVYDSFAGLPQKTGQDQSPSGEQFKQGELAATKAQLITNFKRAHLPLPVIHKGWFADVAPQDLPDTICFAYLDGDFYDSILDSLRLVWPKLQPGATVIVDDYRHEALPGTQKAVDHWLATHKARLQIEASLAILKPTI